MKAMTFFFTLIRAGTIACLSTEGYSRERINDLIEIIQILFPRFHYLIMMERLEISAIAFDQIIRPDIDDEQIGIWQVLRHVRFQQHFFLIRSSDILWMKVNPSKPPDAEQDVSTCV